IAPGPPSDRKTDALTVRQLAPPGPHRMIPYALQALTSPEHRERLARRRPVALHRDIAQPELERVERQTPGELVDQRFDRERGGCCGRRTVGAESHAVGRDAERGQLVCAPAVGPG